MIRGLIPCAARMHGTSLDVGLLQSLFSLMQALA